VRPGADRAPLPARRTGRDAAARPRGVARRRGHPGRDRPIHRHRRVADRPGRRPLRGAARL